MSVQNSDRAAAVRWSLDLGLPDPATFPRDTFVDLVGDTLADGDACLLYGGPGRGGIARGHAGLRTALADRAGLGPEGFMLTSGAAHAIELLWRALLRTGDTYALEAPTWGAAIRLGRTLGANPLPIPMDDQGMQVDVLEQALREGRRLRLVYTIADHHTPTGWSLSTDRRRELLRLAREHDFLIVEDRVYADLRYSGPALPPLATLDGGERVITVGSFSKTLAPSLRCGWLAGPPELVDPLVRLREDLGTSQLIGGVLERFLRSGQYDSHLATVNKLYRRKRDITVAALRRHCGKTVRFAVPDGGMFLWLELADDIDGRQVMARASEAGLVCRPGEAFFGDGGRHHQLFRMAFTMAPEDELLRGVAVLGEAVERSGT